jgi:hypothetical protein
MTYRAKSSRGEAPGASVPRLYAARGPTQARDEIDAYKAELTAQFARRKCWCGCQAAVVIPGQVAIREFGILLQRAKRDRNLCMAHAGLLSNENAA